MLQVSYSRGWSLIINNVVASFLWHKLTGLDPPPNLLSKVQALLVDFSWDQLHWIPQSMLYFPKDEGGQGVIHLSSRGAAFRLEFRQRFLNGPEKLTWRGVACEILLYKLLEILDWIKICSWRIPPHWIQMKCLFFIEDCFKFGVCLRSKEWTVFHPYTGFCASLSQMGLETWDN